MSAQLTTAPAPTLRARCEGLFELGDHANRLLGMEGLRGLAVVLVYFVHSVSAFEAWLPTHGVQNTIARFLEINGHAGVDLFFVLSGFLIWPQPLRKSFDFNRFITRRVKRIYPAFAVILAVTTLLVFAMPPDPPLFSGSPVHKALYFAANALLLPGLISITPIVTVAWTLSYEFFFYLAAPLIVRLGRLQERSRHTRVLILVGLAVALVIGRMLFPWVRLRMVHFLLGAILAEVRGLKRTPNVRDPLGWVEAVTWALLLATAVVTFQLTTRYGESSALTTVPRVLLLTAGLTAFVWAALGRVTPTVRAMSWTPLRWLGNMSYSYYLTHFLTLKFLALVVEQVIKPTPGPMFWALQVVGFVATLVPSAIMFALVERRFSLPKS